MPTPRPRRRRARPLRGASLALLLAAGTSPAALAAPPGTTLLVSRPDGFGPSSPAFTNHSSTWGDPGDGPGESTLRTVSDDDGNRYVAFTSDADGLSGEDDDRVSNVYVRDRATGTTILVSRADGPAGAAANGPSFSPAITPDGRWVAFVSAATNLSDADEAGTSQVYLRDLVSGTTTLVSRADGAAGVIASSTSLQPAIAAVGGNPRVAFVSGAANLPGANGDPQVYLRSGSSTVLISTVDGDATQAGSGRASGPSITADGTRVAFTTEARLVPATDTNAWQDVYVRTVAGDDVVLASRTGAAGAVGNDRSYGASISDDGNRVAFTSRATNLTALDPDSGEDVYVRQIAPGALVLASRATAAGPKGNGGSQGASLSGDGTKVVFSSRATNLAPSDADALPDVFMRNILTATTRHLSTGPGSAAEATGSAPAISRDGDTTAWQGISPGREAGDDDDFVQVYTTYTGPNLAVFTSGWISRPTGTAPLRSRVNASALRTPSRSDEVVHALSANGRYAVFTSDSDELSDADDDRFTNVFRRDNLTGETVLVSRADGVAGPGANGSSGALGFGIPVAWAPAISGDGRVVVFTSAADNLVQGDANGLPDVFARDVAAGTTTLVSRGPNGDPAPTGGVDPDVNGDGTRVVFTTADALVAADDNGDPDVYLRDLAAGTTTLVSRGPGAAGPVGPTGAGSGAISADGDVVAFDSRDPLDPSVVDANAMSDVFVRRLDTAQTLHVSRRAQNANQSGNGPSFAPAISADGSTVVFTSGASDMVSPALDVNGAGRDVFMRGTVGLVTTVLVSRTTGPNGVSGNGPSGRAAVSGDGTRVAFETSASDLVPGDVNGAGDVLLRDVAAASTEIVSRAHDGAQVDGVSGDPALSADGDCVAFATRARNVVPGLPDEDFTRVFVRAVRGDCPLGPAAGAGPGGPPGGPPAGGVTADPVRPRITLLAATPARFAAGARVRRATRTTAAVGTRLRVRVTETSRVALRVDALVPGRRAGRRCVATLRRGRACVRVVLRGTLALGTLSGTRTVAFTGRVGRRTLPAGRYRLTAVATDAAGNRSLPRAVTVTIVAPARRR